MNVLKLKNIEDYLIDRTLLRIFRGCHMIVSITRDGAVNLVDQHGSDIVTFNLSNDKSASQGTSFPVQNH